MDDSEWCAGIVVQADLAWAGQQKDVAVLVRERVARHGLIIALSSV
jgi:hypothetical protein